MSHDVQDASPGSQASEGAGNTANNADSPTITNPDTTNANTEHSSTSSDTSNQEVHAVTVPSSTTPTPSPALKSDSVKEPEASTPKASTTPPVSTTSEPEGAKNGGDTTAHSEPRLTVTGATAGSVAILGIEDKKKVEEVTGQVKNLDLEDKKT